MKIAVSASGNNVEAAMDPRFGRCAYFVIVESETMEFEAIENPATQAGSGAGIQAAQMVGNSGAEAVVAGNYGPNAYGALSAAGLALYQFAGGTVREAVEAVVSGQAQQVGDPTVGSHFGVAGGAAAPGAGAGAGMGGGMGGGMGRGMGQGMGQGMGRGMGQGFQQAPPSDPQAQGPMPPQGYGMPQQGPWHMPPAYPGMMQPPMWGGAYGPMAPVSPEQMVEYELQMMEMQRGFLQQQLAMLQQQLEWIDEYIKQLQSEAE